MHRVTNTWSIKNIETDKVLWSSLQSEEDALDILKNMPHGEDYYLSRVIQTVYVTETKPLDLNWVMLIEHGTCGDEPATHVVMRDNRFICSVCGDDGEF